MALGSDLPERVYGRHEVMVKRESLQHSGRAHAYACAWRAMWSNQGSESNCVACWGTYVDALETLEMRRCVKGRNDEVPLEGGVGQLSKKCDGLA